jgi:hypothetical protein
MFQTWVQLMTAAQGAGTAVTNTVTNTTILPTSALFTFPANFFSYIGQKWRVKAYGIISTLATTPGTLTFNFQFGAVVVGTSGALSLNTTAQTNDTWELELVGTIRALGSGTSTNNTYSGHWASAAGIGVSAPTTNTSGIYLLPATQVAGGVVSAGWDCTVTEQANLFVTWSVANAANSIQLTEYSLEALN